MLYQHYATRRMLPVRRLEMQLAQVCKVLAQVHGNKDAQLTDFLFEYVDPDAIATPEEARAAFEFKPRNVKG